MTKTGWIRVFPFVFMFNLFTDTKQKPQEVIREKLLEEKLALNMNLSEQV